MFTNTKIKNFLRTVLVFAVFTFVSSNVILAQPHSIDRAPEKKLQWNIHLKGLFKKNDAKKKARQKRKEEKKSGYNEIRTFKKNWKRIDHPKELGSKRKVVKRMKKNLHTANRINHGKHKDGTIKRMSRKKIKLPKISMSKIHWPWAKKRSDD